MKVKTIIFGLIIIMSISLSAQNFISENKQWNVLLEGFGYSTEIFWIEGDSVVNSNNYKKIWVSYDSLSTSLFQGLLREADNKVYYIPPNMSEGVLYDFNLQVGDTTTVNNIFCGELGVPITVIDIDYVEHFGITRKRWHIGEDGYVEEYWLEGIGSLNGPLYTKYWYCIVCPVYQLLRFHNNGTLEYIKPGSTDCYYSPVGLNDYRNESNILIKPNPVKKGKAIYLETNFKPDQIFVYNSTGVLMKSVIPKNKSQMTIETNNFDPGLYFISVTTRDKTMTQKIIID